MKQTILLLCAILNSVALGAATTETFDTTTTPNPNTLWNVPNGVYSIGVKTCGGNGFTKVTSNLANYGGKGACVTGTLLVNPGDNVYLNVGIGAGKGSCTGSETTGVCSGDNRNGGSYSDIRIGGQDASSRMMVGGGGGGIGNGGPAGFRISNSGNGGNAGYQNPTSGVYSGDAGASYSTSPGATPNTGGTGGGGGSATAGSAGGGGNRRRRLRNEMALLALAQDGSTDGAGGAGQTSSGGGGGGGYRGGGGGGIHSGGGGGSSYCLSGAGITCTGATQNDGAAYIEITYTAVQLRETVVSDGTFTIPVDVNAVLLEAAGAEGGLGNKGTNGGAPGKGGVAKVYTSVTPGAQYYVKIGTAGQPSAGRTSAAPGGSGLPGGSGYNAGGGGGGTAICTGTTFNPANVVVVAGGGGGASQISKGGDGGGGHGEGRNKGMGATVSAGGAHGLQQFPGKMNGNCPLAGGCGTPKAGTAGAGGDGAFQAQAGGGGGYFGGGAGGTWGGGGGGSSFCANGLSCVFTAGAQPGNGYVKLYY